MLVDIVKFTWKRSVIIMASSRVEGGCNWGRGDIPVGVRRVLLPGAAWQHSQVVVGERRDSVQVPAAKFHLYSGPRPTFPQCFGDPSITSSRKSALTTNISAIHGVIAAPSPSAYLYNIEAHMENLSLHDAGPQGQPGPQQMGQQQQTLGMPPPVPQLPPQMFTTAAQLLDLTDSEFVN
jgi:hypothetical protein